MNIDLEITNKSKKKIRRDFLARIARETINSFSQGKKSAKLSLVFVGEKEICEINRTYRKKNAPTDVLSFLYNSGYNEKKSSGKNKTLEGELIMCVDVISRDAVKAGVSFEKELAFVVAHGILHLLGARHGKKMFALQDKIAATVKN